MDRRTVETILRDWRAAEAALPQDGSTPATALLERIEFLRAEHAAALAARNQEADELGRAPSSSLPASEALS